MIKEGCLIIEKGRSERPVALEIEGINNTLFVYDEYDNAEENERELSRILKDIFPDEQMGEPSEPKTTTDIYRMIEVKIVHFENDSCPSNDNFVAFTIPGLAIFVMRDPSFAPKVKKFIKETKPLH